MASPETARASRPPSSRLKSRALVRSLFDRECADVFRVSAGSVGILARYVERDRMSPVLMGVAVGKRVGNAVARSRVRRRLRESMRHHVRSIADAVPEERTLTCVLLIRGNKVTVGRVRADADQACAALIRRIGETIDRKDSTAV